MLARIPRTTFGARTSNARFISSLVSSVYEFCIRSYLSLPSSLVIKGDIADPHTCKAGTASKAGEYMEIDSVK